MRWPSPSRPSASVASTRRLGKTCLSAVFLVTAVTLAPLLASCGAGSTSGDVMYIGGIPDQDASTLNRRFGSVAEYLQDQLGVKVKYVPTVHYAALVSAFERGDVHLAWFGGLTGVQARASAPGAKAIAQRPRDTKFHSVFVVRAELEVDSLEDLGGLSFTFGSESSTSGHLMPRHFLALAGIDPEDDFRGKSSFSGSHDRTWKLVESGSFQAGALNEAVWEKAVTRGKVDLSKIRVFYTTPPYYDYNWTIRGDMDGTFGRGFTKRVQETILATDPREPQQKEILDLFATDRFIASGNQNYQAIEQVARRLDIIR